MNVSHEALTAAVEEGGRASGHADVGKLQVPVGAWNHPPAPLKPPQPRPDASIAARPRAWMETR